MTPEDRWPGYTPEAQAYEIATRPMTVAGLRAILADAPDDATVRVNLAGIDGSARAVIDGEYLDPAMWRSEAGVLLQIQGGRE